jgi:hypothetical protein
VGLDVSRRQGRCVELTKHLTIRLTAEWAEIERARLESERFLAENGVDHDMAQSLSMVICELLENSMKYGAHSAGSPNVVLDIDLEEESAIIEVSNPFDDTARPHLRRLDRRIQWIRGFADPFEAYVERLKQVSRRPMDDDESGLGLVRIAYEGKAILDFVVAEDGYLNVSAVSELQ